MFTVWWTQLDVIIVKSMWVLTTRLFRHFIKSTNLSRWEGRQNAAGIKTTPMPWRPDLELLRLLYWCTQPAHLRFNIAPRSTTRLKYYTQCTECTVYIRRPTRNAKRSKFISLQKRTQKFPVEKIKTKKQSKILIFHQKQKSGGLRDSVVTELGGMNSKHYAILFRLLDELFWLLDAI